MDQLTIFDVINQFDEILANWINVFNEFDKCYVKAFIPKDALSPLEQGYSGTINPEKERRHKLWGDYTTAIWSYLMDVEKIPQGKAWDEAAEKLKEYRDTEKPCPMEVVRWHSRNTDFRPEHVVEYLKIKED
jgi:hypothetical protein